MMLAVSVGLAVGDAGADEHPVLNTAMVSPSKSNNMANRWLMMHLPFVTALLDDSQV